MNDFKKTVISKMAFDFESLETKRLAVLIILRGHQIGRRCLLNAASLTCGRNSQLSDIVLIEDPSISSKHCEFIWDDEHGTYLIKDLHSLNGTYVNGQPIDEKYLSE